jgi:hypothetical protein
MGLRQTLPVQMNRTVLSGKWSAMKRDVQGNGEIRNSKSEIRSRRAKFGAEPEVPAPRRPNISNFEHRISNFRVRFALVKLRARF